MKYILLYNIDKLSEKILLKSYLDDGYEIASKTSNHILLKKSNTSIDDEETYIKILNSYLKRSEYKSTVKGKVIDVTNAFMYAASKGTYNKLNNKFDWYIKNAIIKEIIRKR